jgi:epoxyqueuosine reductase QueG
MNELQNALIRFVQDYDVDFFGVADLTSVHQFIVAQYGEHLATFPRAITLGIHLPDAVVDELHRHEDLSALLPYSGIYNSVNSSLDYVALRVAQKLQVAGFAGYPIPASNPSDGKTLTGAFSHKLAARLAGMGWISTSCMLITPAYGPRVRWTTVLTDASFEAGQPIASQCGACQACVDICPVNAYIGVPFDPSEPREARFDAHRCWDYFQQRGEQVGAKICGLCVYVCPFGQQRK